MGTTEIRKQLKEELTTLGKEISNILSEQNISSEQIRCVIADIDRCYILLDRFEDVCKDLSYYFTLRKDLCRSLTPLIIALEAFEAGAIDLPSLKSAAEKSNATASIERAIEKLEETLIDA
ncbi:MAG: hypothetical protein WED07_10840 [Candidatus Freyarchaeum deiterrae]